MHIKIIEWVYRKLENYYIKNLDSKFLYRQFYRYLTPIFYLGEMIVYWYYWKYLIKREIFTSDDIIGFLDRNEFGYDGNKIYKIDLLENHEYFDRPNHEEAKEMIRAEFTEAFMKIFSESSIDIENYINLLVTIETKGIRDNGEYHKSKVFTVTLRFSRQFYIDKVKKSMITWTVWFIIFVIIGWVFRMNIVELIQSIL